jgi:chromate transporter
MINLVLFYTFFLIGLFTFGGGMSMMALLEQEVVIHHAWMSAETFYSFIGIAESTPGPIAVNIATAIGYSQGNIIGALCATTGVILPSFAIIVVIAKYFDRFIMNKYVSNALQGLKVVVLGLLLAMVIKIFCINIFSTFSSSEKISFNYQPLIISGIIIIIMLIYKKIFKKSLSPFIIIILSAILGIIFYI